MRQKNKKKERKKTISANDNMVMINQIYCNSFYKFKATKLSGKNSIKLTTIGCFKHVSIRCYNYNECESSFKCQFVVVF